MFFGINRKKTILYDSPRFYVSICYIICIHLQVYMYYCISIYLSIAQSIKISIILYIKIISKKFWRYWNKPIKNRPKERQHKTLGTTSVIQSPNLSLSYDLEVFLQFCLIPDIKTSKSKFNANKCALFILYHKGFRKDTNLTVVILNFLEAKLIFNEGWFVRVFVFFLNFDISHDDSYNS